MQLKTFTGINNKDVLDQIKADLGSDAVILETKNMQVNGQRLVKMTAALDRLDFEQPGASPASPAPPAPGPAPAAGVADAWMLREWGQLKRHLLATLRPTLDLEALDHRQKSSLEFLERAGAGDQAIFELYRRLAARPGMSVLEPLTEMLPVKPWGIKEWPQRLHLVGGPFGAGKTTAAVRLALWLQKSRPGIRICMVNADAERGGGRLLLRHYAGISDLVYREAANPMEMSGVLGEINSQGFDKIIVDLPGLQQGKHLAEVVTGLGLSRLDSIQSALHLVLSPHYDLDALSALLARYRLAMPGSIIWGKLDEGGRFGALLNAAVAPGGGAPLPISAFSFGPGLLNTLVPASAILLWKLLFKHELPSAREAAQPGE